MLENFCVKMKIPKNSCSVSTSEAIILQAYRLIVSASMTTGIARALVRARRRRYPKPENIVPSLCPLCLSITAVGAELRVSVLCAYTRILPALSVARVPTTPKSCQNLTRDLCFHVNICSLSLVTLK